MEEKQKELLHGDSMSYWPGCKETILFYALGGMHSSEPPLEGYFAISSKMNLFFGPLTPL